SLKCPLSAFFSSQEPRKQRRNSQLPRCSSASMVVGGPAFLLKTRCQWLIISLHRTARTRTAYPSSRITRQSTAEKTEFSARPRIRYRRGRQRRHKFARIYGVLTAAKFEMQLRLADIAGLADPRNHLTAPNIFTTLD